MAVLFAEPADGELLSLRQIDELIAKTDYNTALDWLSRYMQERPDAFDAAERRVEKILQIRRSYNALAEQLLAVLETGDDGEETSLKVLGIIAELESLEKNPTDKNIAFIRQAKAAAQFTVYRERYFAIMNEGSALVKNKKYAEAAARFTDGFALYRPEFDAEDYDATLKTSVYDTIDAVRASVARLSPAIAACQTACDAFERAVRAENLSLAQQTFPRVRQAFSDYAAVRNAVVADGARIQHVFASLQEDDPYLGDASFLGFAQRFTLGRASDAASGVLGAIDRFWDDRIGDVTSLLAQTVRAELHTALSVDEARLFLPEETFAAQTAVLPLEKGFAALGSDVQHLYALLTSADGTPVSDFPRASRDAMLLARATGDDIATSYGFARDIARYADLRTQNAPLGADEGAAFSAFVRNLTEAVTRYTQIFAGANAINEKLRTSDATADFSEPIATYIALNQRIADEAGSGAGALWSSLAQACAADSERQYAAFAARHAEAEQRFSGSPDAEQEEGAFVKKYPSQAIALSERLNKDIAQSKLRLTEWRTTLADGAAYRATESGYAQGTDTLDAVIAKLDALLLSSNTLIAASRVQVQNAERASNEATLRYNEAVAALRRGNFESARDALQKARTKYNESLSFEESDRLRAASDEQLVALGTEIASKENEIVVRDVRDLKNRAKNAYYAGNFEEAENRLVQARTRWAMTNVDEDQEITNLFALVTTALSMKTGRVIPPTAPLYPEMSQILSIANQYYNEGASLMKAGKRTEATKILNQAKEKLRSLQLVYPLNQEASLLTLRIDQLIDSASFTAMFAQKVASAKNDYKDTSKRQQAYTDLLDLYEINPSYPGLKQLIYDVEIEIGVRQKPVDNSALVKSKNLSDRAQNIYAAAGRNETQLRSALSLLDEALSLNPNNDAAMLLKDRIQTAIGGKAAVVLTSADEAMYQQAIQALQKNNIVSANAMVEQLLQKPVNRRSAKILDLQKRVKALL